MPNPTAPVVALAADWDTDQTSKHHVMRRVARYRPVVWVEATGMRRPSPRRAGDLRRVLMKLRKIAGRYPRRQPTPDNFTIVSPTTLPFPTSRLAQWINARLYARAIRRALPGNGVAPLLWVYTPTTARFLDQVPHRGLVYHCIDRWWAFDDYDAAEMRACHEILCRRADRVFVSARELEQDCAAFTDRITYMPHGVDWDHFRRALEPAQGAQGAEVGDAMPGRRPVVGFIGLMEEWVDVELMAEIARRHPEADVVIVGAWRVPSGSLAALPNVTLTGRRPFASLPDYLRSFDVALIPFHVNDLTRAVNPLKLREYLSAGVPVVSTALPELLPFAGAEGVDIAADRETFLTAVARRLAQPADRALRLRLSDSMRGEGWDQRVDQMLSTIETPA
ncbi:MAG: glycosyltransferase [Gemmatimonadales bacterium]